jgi:hypothetical protein
LNSGIFGVIGAHAPVKPVAGVKISPSGVSCPALEYSPPTTKTRPSVRTEAKATLLFAIVSGFDQVPFR